MQNRLLALAMFSALLLTPAFAEDSGKPDVMKGCSSSKPCCEQQCNCSCCQK